MAPIHPLRGIFRSVFSSVASIPNCGGGVRHDSVSPTSCATCWPCEERHHESKRGLGATGWRAWGELRPRSSRNLSVRKSGTGRKGSVCRSTWRSCKSEDSDRESRSVSKIEMVDGAEREEERREPAITPVVVAKAMSEFNYITILEFPEGMDHELAGAKVLLLDFSGNMHSVYLKDRIWTNSYWDHFASLPPILPKGPVAFLGLGAGTGARIIRKIWPDVQIEGWEIDGEVIRLAREHMGLAELEESVGNRDGGGGGGGGGGGEKGGGGLIIHIEDAFTEEEGEGEGGGGSLRGRFAGMFVDLFSHGGILPQLRDPDTWRLLKRRLLPGGRIMVNCGGECVERRGGGSMEDGTWTWTGGSRDVDATLSAMAEVFPEELSRRLLGGSETNTLALTGTFPDLEAWEAALPEIIGRGIKDWSRVGTPKAPNGETTS